VGVDGQRRSTTLTGSATPPWRPTCPSSPAELRRIAEEIIAQVPDPMWIDGVDLSSLDNGLS
jgi:hypothetical protein